MYGLKESYGVANADMSFSFSDTTNNVMCTSVAEHLGKIVALHR